MLFLATLLVPSAIGTKTIASVDGTTLEILSKVDQFYGNAWNHLDTTLNTGLIFITIAVAVFGVFMPLYLQYLSKKNYDREYASLKTSTTEKINTEIGRLQSQISQVTANLDNLRISLKNTEAEWESSYNHAIGGVFFVQGDLAKQQGQMIPALASYLNALANTSKLQTREIFLITWERVDDLIKNPALILAVKGDLFGRKTIKEALDAALKTLTEAGSEKYKSEILELNQFSDAVFKL